MSKLQRIAALSSPLVAVTLFFSAAYVASAASDTWSSTPSSANWNTANWTGGNNPPLAGDALSFGSSSITTLNNNFTAGTAFDGIYFTGGNSFIMNGGSVLISGAVSNTVAVQNSSGTAQTLGTLPVALDWGYYTFSSFGSLALNGGLSANTGGIAYFDSANTSSSLTPDGNGLITGLDGAAMIYDGSFTPTSLATISGTTISAFTATTPVGLGAIGSGNVIELTANGTATAYTANNNTVTALVVDQAGNAGGTATDTLTVTGTLTFANQGGVYLLGGVNGNKACVSVTGGTLTAGTSGPASLIFAVDGNNANNQASVGSAIVNNAGSGAVSVVKTGPGSMNFATTTTSSYTGGVYVDQGQLQFGQLQQVGTGPIFVGENASLYYIGTGIISNNITLSPGGGASVYGSAAAAPGASFLVSGASGTLAGTLTLAGAPVSPANFPAGTISAAAVGDAFNGNATGGAFTWTGQVTGPGTMTFTGAHSYTLTMKNTASATPNNWAGGMIIGGHGGSAVNVDIKMGATNQIPNGPGTGDLAFVPATGNSANGPAIFDLNTFNTTVNALVGTAGNVGGGANNATITNSGATPCTLTFGANNDSATYNGAFGDGGLAKALSLVKVGTGNQTLGGNLGNDHGNVTVNGGTLSFGNSASPANAPTVTVAAGAILDSTAAGSLALGASQILNCAGQINGTTQISGTFEALDPSIGTFTNSAGTVTLNGGSTYIWDINNATGTAGGDPGWTLLKATNGGSIFINATSGTPIAIDITSLTAGDVAGSALNFNPNASASWKIATADGGISGFTGSSQFSIVTSAFANAPASTPKWSVSQSGNNLLLNYTAASTITTGLVNQTNNLGSTATFTVVANGATPPITFNWFQGANQLFSPGTSAGGGAVTITTNSHTSTLTIANVQDADASSVAGGITVNVSDNFSDTGSSGATLTIIDPPTSPLISQSLDSGVSAGGLVGLTASALGTQPFTYTWYLNGVLITNSTAVMGVGTSNLVVRAEPSQNGVYSVVIANSAGSATNTYTIGPVSSVPGQIIFEPFDSYVAQPAGGGQSFDTWEGMTNLFNQLTDSPAWWFHSSGSGIQMVVSLNDLANGIQNQQGGTYPWPGLAGNSTNELYWTSSLNSHLEFGQIEGFPSGTKVYASFVMSMVSAGSSDGVTDVLAGFTSSLSGTAFNLKLCSVITNHAANQIALGIGKGAGANAQTVDANTLWTGPLNLQQDMFIVLCYTVVSGGNIATDDTVSMWINPAPSTFYASETSAPAPDLGPASFGVSNSVIRDFAVHATAAPGSRRITDLRIGTTWASVTPPSGPTLSLGNVYAPAGTTATLASANAGNPVLNYGWQHNGGAALTDGPTGHGSTISGSSTYALSIANVQPLDYGVYTVNGTNLDISPLDSPTNLTGSASGLLTGQPPRLNVTHTGPNVVISWPTNWIGFVLEQTPSVSPTSWTTNSLPPYAVSGTNNDVTIPISGSQEYYRLSNH